MCFSLNLLLNMLCFFFFFHLELLVGIQNCEVTVENSMEVPQNLKTELPYDPENPFVDVYVK